VKSDPYTDIIRPRTVLHSPEQEGEMSKCGFISTGSSSVFVNLNSSLASPRILTKMDGELLFPSHIPQRMAPPYDAFREHRHPHTLYR
jgi:hypothetical protein